jgi:predicted regulator of Ras-like GTPase activity (Roadblock/LC7/MglB family)
MIRSRRIPQVLDRICDDKLILSALLVTADGELLGTSTNRQALQPDPESFGTLVADMAVDYIRLGEDYGNGSKSPLHCLLMEHEQGTVGVAQCGDCFVMAVAAPDAPLGLIKARLEAVAVHVQEGLSTLNNVV